MADDLLFAVQPAWLPCSSCGLDLTYLGCYLHRVLAQNARNLPGVNCRLLCLAVTFVLVISAICILSLNAWEAAGERGGEEESWGRELRGRGPGARAWEDVREGGQGKPAPNLIQFKNSNDPFRPLFIFLLFSIPDITPFYTLYSI